MQILPVSPHLLQTPPYSSPRSQTQLSAHILLLPFHTTAAIKVLLSFTWHTMVKVFKICIAGEVLKLQHLYNIYFERFTLQQLVEGNVKLPVTGQLTLTHAAEDNHTGKSGWAAAGTLTADKSLLWSKAALFCIYLLTATSIWHHLWKVLPRTTA